MLLKGYLNSYSKRKKGYKPLHYTFSFKTSSSRSTISEFPSVAAERGGRCDNGPQPGGKSHTNTPVLLLPNVWGQVNRHEVFLVCRWAIYLYYNTTHQWRESTGLKKKLQLLSFAHGAKFDFQCDRFLANIYSNCMKFSWWISSRQPISEPAADHFRVALNGQMYAP